MMTRCLSEDVSHGLSPSLALCTCSSHRTSWNIAKVSLRKAKLNSVSCTSKQASKQVPFSVSGTGMYSSSTVRKCNRCCSGPVLSMNLSPCRQHVPNLSIITEWAMERRQWSRSRSRCTTKLVFTVPYSASRPPSSTRTFPLILSLPTLTRADQKVILTVQLHYSHHRT